MSEVGETILNVDDSESIRYAKSRSLRRAGYRVLESGTGTEALRLAAAERPALVLLDINLPDMSGIEVCRRIKQRYPTMLVLQSSASFVESEDRVRGLEGGADSYLTEPVAPTELVAAVRALLRLRRAERAAQESDAKFRAMTESLPQIVWSATADGRHDYYNRRWQEFVGEAAADGAAWTELVHPQDRDAVMRQWQQALATGENFSAEFRLLRAADKIWRWFIARALPIRDSAGRINGWLGTWTDVQELVEAREVLARGREELEGLVAGRTAELKHALDQLQTEMTERERAEAELRQSQKMEAIGQLTGGIAHDFNNLLAGIGGSMEMIRTRIAQGRSAAADSYINAALGEVARAASLTHRLLAFARRQALNPKPVDVNALITSMEDLIDRTIGSHIALRKELDPGDWVTLCDANQLENALLNLCINARDAMPDGGVLTIATTREELHPDDARPVGEAGAGAYVILSVSDTGTGMTPEVAARAFDPFYTTKPIGQGTGLGLSMVYGFAQQSGGHARIASRPGQGTTVQICLPCHLAGKAALHDPAAAPGNGSGVPQVRSGRSILVVEDEPVVRELIVEFLTELGYAVREAAESHPALEILRSDARIDLLISDVGLPGMNGRQLAGAAREARADLKVLFISGYVPRAAAGNLALPAGMDTITKPFALDELATRVRRLIEG